MNPILDMLGLQNPAEMKGLQIFGGDKAVLNGNLEGMVFSEILGMGMSEKNAEEVLTNLFASNPESLAEGPGTIPEFVLPELVAEGAPAVMQETNPENPQGGNPGKDVTLPTAFAETPEITAVTIEDAADNPDLEDAALVLGKNADVRVVQPENPVKPLLVMTPVNSDVKATAGMQEMNPDPDFTAYKQNAGLEPIVTVEKGLEPLGKDVNPESQRIIEALKGAVNLKEFDVTANVKPQKEENSGPVKVALDVKPGEFLKQTGDPAKGDGQPFDLNRQNAQQVNLKELASGTEKDLSGGKEQFKALFESKPVEIRTGAQPTAAQARLDADFAAANNSQASAGGLETAKVEVPAARFIVPQELNDGKSLNNRTVMIKMEPENLGPIRMTLSSFHDNLSARLVVDTAAAKTAVEANLNQLVDQLGRQGIKVEFFQISVGHSQVGEDTGDRNAAGFARGSGRAHKGYRQYGAIDHSSGITNRVRQYIGAGGVNCFA